jgi:hypothetical protein
MVFVPPALFAALNGGAFSAWAAMMLPPPQLKGGLAKPW